MTLQEIKEEIAKLEIEATAVSEADKPIIEEEIERLQLEASKFETQLIVEDEETLKAARAETGESGRMQFPQAKTITINNRSKEVEINGQLVTPRPEETFVISTRDKTSGEYTDEHLGATLTGVVLKVRYQMFSKYKVDPRYLSFEFGDTRRDLVKVFTGTYKDPQIIFYGSYADAKTEFATEEKDSMGNFKKSFDLFAMLYMDIGGSPYKLKVKLTKGCGLFDYLSTFGENESYLGYETEVTLRWNEVTSSVKFWEPEFKRGKKVDLKHYLDVLKDLNKFFDIIDGKTNMPTAPIRSEISAPMDPTDDYSQPEPEDIDISQIPF